MSAAPTAAPPVPRFAVAINATPWAIVEVDGDVVGETPIAGMELSAGRHAFSIRMADGSLREKTVDVRGDLRLVFE